MRPDEFIGMDGKKHRGFLPRKDGSLPGPPPEKCDTSEDECYCPKCAPWAHENSRKGPEVSFGSYEGKYVSDFYYETSEQGSECGNRYSNHSAAMREADRLHRLGLKWEVRKMQRYYIDDNTTFHVLLEEQKPLESE